MVVGQSEAIPLRLNIEEWEVIDSMRAYACAERSDFAGPQTLVDWLSVWTTARRLDLTHAVVWNRGTQLETAGLQEAVADFRSVTASLWNLQVSAASEIHDLLEAEGISHVFFKGVQLNSLLHDGRQLHLMSDIDILISPNDKKRAFKVMHACGYGQEYQCIHGRKVHVPAEAIRSAEEKHYEFFAFNKFNEMPQLAPSLEFIRQFTKSSASHIFTHAEEPLRAAVQFELHHNVSHGIDLKDVWASPSSFTLGKRQLSGLNLDFTVWFLAARLYHEVMIFDQRKAKLLCDLAALLRQHVIDFDRVVALSEKYKVQAALYYVLVFVSQYCGSKIPSPVLGRLYNGFSDGRLRNWGDFSAKLLMRSPQFTFVR